jgi:hypothetical protein
MPSQHKSIILSFIMSKDDNLLLLIGGLMHSVIKSDLVTTDVWNLAPEIALKNMEQVEEKKTEITEEE